MGHKPTPAEEIELLRETIRDAHAAIKDLRAEIRRADRLAPQLVEAFEQLHEREIEQLSNHMTAEANRQSALLNESVSQARQWILQQLTAQELVLDPANGVVLLNFPNRPLDDDVPLPYPQHQTKEDTP